MNAWARPTQQAKRQLDRSTQFHTTTQQSPHWLQWVTANSPPKLPLPLRRSPPKSNTPIPSPTPLPSQTASGSNQPFCHNTDVRTDRRGTTWSITIALCSAILIASDALIILQRHVDRRQVLSTVDRRPLPVDHTQRPDLCSAR